jgi:hypothetical protein
MSLDPASYSALWQIAQETGVLPEHILPTLYFESGFDPSVQNRSGAEFFGLNQASTNLIANLAGVDPQTYLTWPASRQLSTVVRGYVKSLVARYGHIGSATRFEQANFYPVSLDTARGLSDVIVAKPSSAYEANKGFDKNGKGNITVGDLAAVMMKAASSAAVQHAIATTYAAKGRYMPLDVGVTGFPDDMDLDGITLATVKQPAIGLGAPSPEDVNHIVYGDDFGFWAQHPQLQKAAIAGSIALGTWALVTGIRAGMLNRWVRWL